MPIDREEFIKEAQAWVESCDEQTYELEIIEDLLAVLESDVQVNERRIEIDTIVKDLVTAYFKRYITNADEILLNRAPLSKGQLLRYVQHRRDAAETGLKAIEELYLPTRPKEKE